MRKDYQQTINHSIFRRGAATSTEIATELHVSKPTVLGALKKIGAIGVGNSVARTYVLPREISNLGNAWNLYRIDETARPERVGILRSTSAGFYFKGDFPAFFGNEFPNGIFDNMPWFLVDHRPQGFIGRSIAHKLKKFGFPDNPNAWNDEKILEYFVRFGSDIPGALILGEQAKDEFLSGHKPELRGNDRETMYPAFARNAIADGEPQSSAAGEQPKFCVMLEDGESFRNVIVKFSGKTDSEINRRRGDLLVAEHTAAQILGENGVPVPRTNLVFAENRVFLESERIDRDGRYGRRQTCSLTSIDAAFIGRGNGSWSNAMKCAPEYFDEDEIKLVECIHDFGAAIGNTDMHFGNLSFYIARELPFRLAPVYDMSPTVYAPRSDGSMLQDALQNIPPTEDACRLAVAFWGKLKTEKRLSENFRAIAEANLAAARKFEKNFSRAARF